MSARLRKSTLHSRLIVSTIGLFFIRAVKTLFLMGSGTCRFTPTCSEYAMQAMRQKPFLTAIVLISKRIVRCNPFCKGGYDPLPL